MRKDDAIIHPSQQEETHDLGPFAIMVATPPDLSALRKHLYEDHPRGTPLALSRLYPSAGVSLVGPVMGAPYAAYVMESLIAWGVRKVLFLGWCGAIAPHVRIGDIILPTSAFIDEGTSSHYRENGATRAAPSPEMVKTIEQMLHTSQLDFHDGPVWSTDAIFRETPEKVAHFQSKGAMAVEMEVSALYSVSQFRNVDVGALLVVSDELSSLTWKPGFRNSRFRDARQAIYRGIKTLCQER